MSDPFQDSVVLLQHMEEATFKDTSKYNHAITNNAGAAIDNAIFKFGGGSLKCPFRAAALSAADAPEFDLSTGDFTIEGWLYWTTSGFSGTAVFKKAPGNQWPYKIQSDAAGILTATGFDSVGASVYSLTSGVALANVAWTHFALVRFVNRFDLYIAGTSVANTSSASALSVVADLLYIGGNPGPSDAWPDRIDDIRITKGVARYTANFTPPTAPFDDYVLAPSGGFVYGKLATAPAFPPVFMGASLGAAHPRVWQEHENLNVKVSK